MSDPFRICKGGVCDGTIIAREMDFCSECWAKQEDEIDGHRRAPEEADCDSDPEGGERPGADTTGTAAALTGEDAGAGSGAYPGVEENWRDFSSDVWGVRYKDGIGVIITKQDIVELGCVPYATFWQLARTEIDRRALAPGAAITLTAAEMRQLMQSAGMLRPQMPLATFQPTVGTAPVTVTTFSGGGAGGVFTRGRQIPTNAYNQAVRFLGPLTPSQYALLAPSLAVIQARAMYGQPSPPKPVEDGGIVVGEIVAWRCWNLTAGCLLRSIAVDSTWTPGQPMSAGDGPHGADWEAKFPHSGGVHAWKKKEDAFKYGAAGVGPQGAIIGTVRLSGQVIEHERGYRAEVAEIASLDWLVSDLPLAEYNSLLQRVRALYGVEGEGGYMKPLDSQLLSPIMSVYERDTEESSSYPMFFLFAALGVAIFGAVVGLARLFGG